MKVTLCASDYNPSVSACAEPPPFAQGRLFSYAPMPKHTSESVARIRSFDFAQDDDLETKTAENVGQTGNSW